MRDLRWLVFIPFCWTVYQLFRGRSRQWSNRAWSLAYLGLSAVFFASAITKFTAYEVNGVDFSIFDWALHNTIRGHFMWSQFCNCNHFGVHPTWLFLGLVPLHFFWTSPWLLVLCHAFSLAVSLPLLKRLIKIREINLGDSEIFLVLTAVTASQALGSINNYGFHPETWYLPIGLWFLSSWFKDRWFWLVPAIFFMAVKEDGALFLASWSLGSLFFKQFRRQSFALSVLSIVIFVLNTKLVQPLAWESQIFRPSWTVFWAKYGNTPTEIVLSTITNPVTTFTDILSSSSWHWFLPFAFLPLFSWRAVMGMLPGIVMLSLASSPLLRGFGVYYAAPILPFALFGWLSMIERIQEIASKQTFMKTFIVITCLLGFVGGVGPRLGKPKPEVTVSLKLWIERYKTQMATNPICVQTALYPHIGYIDNLVPLVDKERCDNKTIVDSRIDPYPFETKNELLQNVQLYGWQDLANP